MQTEVPFVGFEVNTLDINHEAFSPIQRPQLQSLCVEFKETDFRRIWQDMVQPNPLNILTTV